MATNPLTLLKSLFAGIPLSDHIVSVDKIRKGPVTAADVKLEQGIVKFDYKFKVDGTEIHIQGESAFANAGRRGGNDVITVDGEEVLSDDIILSNRIVTGGLAILIIFEYVDSNGNSKVVRIDALRRWMPLNF